MVDINATQLAGLMSFAVPAFFSALAGRRVSPHWFIFAALYALLVVEIAIGTRHMISGTLSAWTSDTWLYANRRGILAVIIIATIALAAIARIFFIAKSNHPLPNRMALMAANAIIALFVLELASLHQVSALLYTPIGPILLIGWIWLVIGSIAALSAHSAQPHQTDDTE